MICDSVKCRKEISPKEDLITYVLTERMYSNSMKKFLQSSKRFCSLACIKVWIEESLEELK